jgi:hypothetical protein
VSVIKDSWLLGDTERLPVEAYADGRVKQAMLNKGCRKLQGARQPGERAASLASLTARAPSGGTSRSAIPTPIFFQEGSRRFASGKDPDEIVEKSLLRTVNSYDDGVRPEFDGIGIEEGFEFALANELLDALRVAILDSGEGRLAVRNRDTVAHLAGQAHGGFHRGVAAADDEDFLFT